MNPPSSFQHIITTLCEHDLEFVICGGVACVLQGVQRVTNDIDINIRMTDENLHKLLNACRALQLQPRFPEPIEAILDATRRQVWIEEKQAKVVTLVSLNHDLQIDVFLQYPFSYDELKESASSKQLNEKIFLISSRRHLIEAKKLIDPPRPSDLYDIAELEALEHET